MKYIYNILTLIIIVLLLSSCTYYEIKNDGVYYKSWNEAHGKSSYLIPDADQNTFEILSDKLYGKDKNFVFYEGYKVPGADPSSFKLLENMYAIDKHRAFVAGDSITNSNSDGFEIIANFYSKDKNDVYYGKKPLNVCSIKDFKPVYSDDFESNWATDGCYYYIRNFKIPSKEYQNVKLFKESAGIAMDSKYVYYLGRNIYFNEKGKRVLDTIDIVSFQVTDYISCEDKYGCINVYHGRDDCD